MNIQRWHLRIDFTSPFLGTSPGRGSPAHHYLVKKAMEENPNLTIEDMEQDEKTIPEILEDSTTVFRRDPNGRAKCVNYQVKGMFKECGEQFNGEQGLKQMRSRIDNTLFVFPRDIPIHYESEIEILERPLRAMTQQGPRVSLARSEMIRPPAWIECDIQTIDFPKIQWNYDLLRMLLDYSDIRGFGQWRNSGYYGCKQSTISRID